MLDYLLHELSETVFVFFLPSEKLGLPINVEVNERGFYVFECSFMLRLNTVSFFEFGNILDVELIASHGFAVVSLFAFFFEFDELALAKIVGFVADVLYLFSFFKDRRQTVLLRDERKQFILTTKVLAVIELV